MFKSSILIFVLFFSVSFSGFAQSDKHNNIWKKSHYFEKQGDYEKAAAVIKAKVDANEEYALLRYAHLKYKQGEYNESIDAYHRAMEISPKSLDAKLGILLPYAAQQRWRQIKIYTRQILVLSDWNYMAHENLMVAEEKTKKWHTLDRHAARLSKAYPMNAEVLGYYGRANAWQGDEPVSKAAYEKVLMRDPDNAEAIDYINNN